MKRALALLALVVACLPAAAQDYDVLIRNGRVVDGDGKVLVPYRRVDRDGSAFAT